MIRQCTKENEKNKIISYIGPNYPSCLYLFLDLLKYGFDSDSDSVKVYIQYDDNCNIIAILLSYYSCLHLFSKDNSYNLIELASFFLKNGFTMLYCSTESAKPLYKELKQKYNYRVTITNGWVARIQNVDKKPKGIAVSAKDKDFIQVTKMIYEDEDIGKSYKYDELAKQLEERNKEGYARNKVIKKGNLVIAHACTNAELDNIAIVAELIVREEYRNKGLATEIWRDLCQELISENKEVYSFYYSDESRRIHKHIGFYEICDWSKIVVLSE